ncbi:MAG: selenium-dependent xanthine dehydrogenase [Spirochaetes bacterium]|nr:selenium-dependent xanthine dehydrogenase [Spirochaetota bacterium]
MIHFTLNGKGVSAEGGTSLLEYLRGVECLTAAKNGCSEGACGACMVLVDGKAITSCVVPLERMEGKSVVTIEGLPARELDAFAAAFAETGAVQCGFCIPGMVISAKAVLDADPDPDEKTIRAGIRRNICRCTGYVKIVRGILLAGRYLREGIPGPAVMDASIGARLLRVDAAAKVRGEAKFVDDLAVGGMLHGAALRSAFPRARLLSLDVSVARALPGVAAVLTWEDIPGKRIIGKLTADWPTLVAVGEETRYVGDAVALVAADSVETAREALSLVRVGYEELPPLVDPEAAMAPGAPQLHPGGNVFTKLVLDRGDAAGALARATHVAKGTFKTPFTEHAFMEPESALAWPPDAEGIVVVHTSEQNVYDGRKYVAATLGIPEERIRIKAEYVGGGFGGKEDQTVQHHAALLAWKCGRPVKSTLSRAESLLVHPKRHPMTIELTVGCDERGRLLGMRGRIVADTGAYASLGGPVLHRAVTHVGGPYAFSDIMVEGFGVYTNNPPAGAFRGFGVPQVNFALESCMNLLAAKVGISPWELRWRNAVRPGDALPNGQIAGPDTALVECLLAVKDEYDKAPERSGLACGFKNTGIGVGHRDIGRCILKVGAEGVEVLTGAACIGQGLATILTQIACDTLGIGPDRVSVARPDTFRTPDSGTTTASRQTLITGEACRRACLDAAAALAACGMPVAGGYPYAAVAGTEYAGEFLAETDPFDSTKAHPVAHVAYSYAVHLARLDGEGRVEYVKAVHDSGRVVNPLGLEAQIEGGVVMGLGFALTEDFPVENGRPTARMGTLGLFRAPEVPPIETLMVRKEADALAFGAKGIGEISTIPTASAIAGAFYARDGQLRTKLPLANTPYSKKS